MFLFYSQFFNFIIPSTLRQCYNAWVFLIVDYNFLELKTEFKAFLVFLLKYILHLYRVHRQMNSWPMYSRILYGVFQIS